MDWRHHAECQYEDPELFFPLSPTKVAEAKAVCAGCPVRAACLAYAFTTGQDAGIWGGMTENDRRLELRRRLPCPHPRPYSASAGTPTAQRRRRTARAAGARGTVRRLMPTRTDRAHTSVIFRRATAAGMIIAIERKASR